MATLMNLCEIPAALSPEGYGSNFVNPASMAPALIGVIAVTTLWAIVFTTARIYMNSRKLGWADWLNLIALLHSISILGIEGTPCFFDAKYAQGIYIPAVLLQTGAFFAKASIFLLYLQLFTVRRPMRIAIYAGITFSFLLYGVGVAVATYYETPRAGEKWTDVLDGRTLIPLPWWQAQSALSVALDVYIFILPLPVVTKLKMPLQKRIQLVAVFSLALGGIASSIASLVERIQIAHAYDQTWISAILSLCSAVELNVAIIVGSAPAFAGFARSYFIDSTVVRRLLSSISLTSKAKLYDSEAPLEYQKNTNENHSAKIYHQYYELNDVGTVRMELKPDEK
ncbi:hypothetical protein EKO27_g8726 [Xylaria grammica]|uniref:Rhodopsin domain-containing protein n=1 Tax=Xylaria grammica TaxID=363999 RepID=A0A439CVZ2_9PEZI|nr:hypothetical protein EKO27_g8726 [Xylaria grammica]